MVYGFYVIEFIVFKSEDYVMLCDYVMINKDVWNVDVENWVCGGV